MIEMQFSASTVKIDVFSFSSWMSVKWNFNVTKIKNFNENQKTKLLF